MDVEPKDKPLPPVEPARLDEPERVLEAEKIVEPPPRWIAPAFFLLGIGLVPWIVLLALTLPRRHGTHFYDIAWTGFDVALALLLVATGVGALRRATWLQGVAAAAATLLVCDAWFDVLSSTSTHELLAAIALAAFVEIPVAAACILVARYAEEASERARRYAAFARRMGKRQRRPPR
jgi:hypothetical protein